MALPRVLAGRRRRRIAGLVANGVAQAGCGFGLALGIRELMRAAEQGALSLGLLSGLVALGAAMLALRIREASDSERLGQDYVMRVRMRVFEQVARRPAADGEDARTGVTLTRLTGDLNSLRNWVSLGVARSIVASCSIAGLLAALVHLSPSSAAVTVGMVAVCGVAWISTLPLLRGSVREARRRRGRLANNLSEKVLAARAVVQLGRTADERRRIRRDSERLRDALVRRARWSAFVRSLPDVVWPIGVVAMAGSLVVAGGLSSEIVAALLLVGMVVSSLSQIARALDYRVAFEEGRRRIEQTLSGPQLREARDSVALGGDGPLSLEIEGIVLPGAANPLALRASPGDRIVVVGPTGSGKTTLLALAARLRDPEMGRICIDGIPLPKIELASLREAVQLVSRQLPLLRGTVAENVGYGVPDEGLDWLRSVAELCGLTRDPALAPLGLETRVDEGGSNLPHGLQRRILLARALAMRPRLLLIDEPEILTDPESRIALDRALEETGATTLVVGPEQGDLGFADHVWRLPSGSVEEPWRDDSNVRRIRCS